ncbi:hypothetical protein M9H77_24025 [Catharanthus roseus]|uniref:Uncharacterized protein n=1 Tax=Catharanthus roseus TaxID=4058 RepID=A0ACC0AW62_CATRO|nr:hypothetical protein M9H77_24025 [Catharanthus roseus]
MPLVQQWMEVPGISSHFTENALLINFHQLINAFRGNGERINRTICGGQGLSPSKPKQVKNPRDGLLHSPHPSFLSLYLRPEKQKIRRLSTRIDEQEKRNGMKFSAQSAKPISSPVPEVWYPTLAGLMLAVGLVITASFFIYEATSSRKNRSLAKEVSTGAIASVFLGFGSLFLLLASGVYV